MICQLINERSRKPPKSVKLKRVPRSKQVSIRRDVGAKKNIRRDVKGVLPTSPGLVFPDAPEFMKRQFTHLHENPAEIPGSPLPLNKASSPSSAVPCRAESGRTDVPPEALSSGDSIYGTPVHNRTYLKSTRTTAIPDTVMALPLINQPALGGIKDPGRGGNDTAPHGRNLLILFPEGRRWVPSTYLAPRRSLPGVRHEKRFSSGFASSLCLILPSSPRAHRSSSRGHHRTSPHGRNYRGRHPAITVMPRTLYVLRQLPGPPIISDEMTPPNGRVMTTPACLPACLAVPSASTISPALMSATYETFEEARGANSRFAIQINDVPGFHSESDAKQLGSTVTIGFHVRMISRAWRVDILVRECGRDDDVWRRMRDGRRVESRRPSDETPERLLSVPETGRRLRLQRSSPKFRERNHVAESEVREEPLAVGGFFYRTQGPLKSVRRNAEITVDTAAGAAKGGNDAAAVAAAGGGPSEALCANIPGRVDTTSAFDEKRRAVQERRPAGRAC
ncbi:hypothetical protein DBV15_10544 [Temnothorax longispinosus]|uniref:Uncharacterized protein n=1 Tax=Temnothorax longispinosus TaxID=300112 RepID=A0A4S2L1X4_9HYME|nr:hypothetical protein DBV15_10544 [Temnothorax longispinosus]